jgi:putative ABC transport system ATP-binding protein
VPIPAQPANLPLIQVQQLQKHYRVGATVIPALRGVSFSVRRGEFVAVVGPSGSGKSTLLNLIAGVDTLTSGEVLVDGRSIHRLNETERARWRGTSVGIVFQFFQMLPTMTLLANVMLPMELAGRFTQAQRRARAADLLARVGLADQIHKLPSRVSGGQQQRAAVARAWPTTRPYCSAMSRPATSTAAPPRSSSASFLNWLRPAPPC